MAMDLDEVGRLSNRVLDEVERAVVGKREALELLMLGLLADGHVLIEDYPGLAKTLMARSFAAGRLDRLQAHPVHARPDAVRRDRLVDLQPARGRIRVPPGPIFANLLLADEINRAPPKTQAALLEAMQERQVTTRGRRRAGSARRSSSSRPRTRSSTRAPTRCPRRSSTASCCGCRSATPRARTSGAARGPAERGQRRRRARAGRRPRRAPRDAGGVRGGVRLRAGRAYMVDIVAATRDAQSVQVGASPRGSLALLKLALPRGDRRPRLRHARRRQGGRRPRARAPADAAAGAVGAARLGRGGRARAARGSPDAGRRGFRADDPDRSATPKLVAYAALSAVGP